MEHLQKPSNTKLKLKSIQARLEALHPDFFGTEKDWKHDVRETMGKVHDILSQQKEDMIAVLEGMKPILWHEIKEEHWKNCIKYNTLDEAITRIKEMYL